MSKRLSLLLLVSALTALPFGIARAGDAQSELEVRNVTSRDLSVYLSGLCIRGLDIEVMVRAGARYQRPFLVDQECLKQGHATVRLTINRWRDPRGPDPRRDFSSAAYVSFWTFPGKVWSVYHLQNGSGFSFHFQGAERRLMLDVHSQ